MSILESLARARRDPEPARGPRLRALPHPAFHPPRMPFVLLVLVLLGAGLIGLLLINTSLQQGSFTVHDLRQKTSTLSDRQRALQREVSALEAPEHLASRASELGMVASGQPAFLRLSDGRILGHPEPATAPPPPAPTGPEANGPEANGAGSTGEEKATGSGSGRAEDGANRSGSDSRSDQGGSGPSTDRDR